MQNVQSIGHCRVLKDTGIHEPLRRKLREKRSVSELSQRSSHCANLQIKEKDLGFDNLCPVYELVNHIPCKGDQNACYPIGKVFYLSFLASFSNAGNLLGLR
ncbi:hypothetical protein EVAR_13844_1 [Eumeta japonica]|uniref:Uncharacterized protein n=1 Tax=Eumeta variegata TaxID=151549 RepID=A0A4C1U198_EUMVA|nr:hypothetical protein EVAR_13844_1 [Eumeta japonica]